MSKEAVSFSPLPVPDHVRQVLRRLHDRGFEGWLVGGCVRDSLLGRTPEDYDIATNAQVRQTVEAFHGFRVIETGIKHGTVTVISDGRPVEITTYRVDGAYSDGRHPDSVRFASDISEDLARRDFTVNAIAYSPEHGFMDFFGGAEDLRRGVIRCVGDPDTRFGEDALRILRALRFAAVLGFDIEADTAAAIHRCKPLLGRIAKERITAETVKLLCGRSPDAVLRAYSDVAAEIIPPLADMFGLEQRNPHHIYDVWEHTLHVLAAVPPEPTMRLAALLHDAGKPRCMTVDEHGVGHFYGHAAVSQEIAADVFRLYLRMDRQTCERVLTLIKYHDQPLPPDRKVMRRRLTAHGEETLRQLLALQRADCRGQAPSLTDERLRALDQAEQIVNELLAENACLSVRDLQISGSDLLGLGTTQGPSVGALLRQLLTEVCNEQLSNTHAALMARAAQLIDDNSINSMMAKE